MALLLQEKINEEASWALWEITEPEDVLLHMLKPGTKELEELNLIRSDARRLEWLATRVLIKQLVQAHKLTSGGLIKDDSGKPFLKDSTAFVSLSHSYPFAAAILNERKTVGIDIEKSREQLLRVQHKFLNEEEKACAGNNLHKLCVYWTAKETLYKVYGRRGLLLQENIRINPFDLQQKGTLLGKLETKEAKESYTLHYRLFNGLHICFSL